MVRELPSIIVDKQDIVRPYRFQPRWYEFEPDMGIYLKRFSYDFAHAAEELIDKEVVRILRRGDWVVHRGCRKVTNA